MHIPPICQDVTRKNKPLPSSKFSKGNGQLQNPQTPRYHQIDRGERDACCFSFSLFTQSQPIRAGIFDYQSAFMMRRELGMATMAIESIR